MVKVLRTNRISPALSPLDTLSFLAAACPSWIHPAFCLCGSDTRDLVPVESHSESLCDWLSLPNTVVFKAPCAGAYGRVAIIARTAHILPYIAYVSISPALPLKLLLSREFDHSDRKQDSVASFHMLADHLCLRHFWRKIQSILTMFKIS